MGKYICGPVFFPWTVTPRLQRQEFLCGIQALITRGPWLNKMPAHKIIHCAHRGRVSIYSAHRNFVFGYSMMAPCENIFLHFDGSGCCNWIHK